MRPQTYRVELSEGDRVRLLLLVRQGSAPARVIRRAHVSLRAKEGVFDHEVGAALHLHPVGRQRWTMQMLADKLVELTIVEAISDETVRRTLKTTRRSLGSELLECLFGMQWAASGTVQMARTAVDQAQAFLQNRSTDLPEKQSLDCELVTRENADQFGVFARK